MFNSFGRVGRSKNFIRKDEATTEGRVNISKTPKSKDNLFLFPKSKDRLYQLTQRQYQRQSPMSVRTGGLLK